MKEITGYDIEIFDRTVDGTKKTFARITPSKSKEQWHRYTFDRKKDGILIPEIALDMQKIKSNLVIKNEEGLLTCKYDFVMVNLPPNPKSSQGSQKNSYKQALIECLRKHEDDLLKFKGKEVLIYLIIYLRTKRINTHDVDNFLKVILDSLKEFIGDDAKVVSLHVDKKEIKDYPVVDLDFIEQVVLIVTLPQAKSILFA